MQENKKNSSIGKHDKQNRKKFNMQILIMSTGTKKHKLAPTITRQNLPRKHHNRIRKIPEPSNMKQNSARHR